MVHTFSYIGVVLLEKIEVIYLLTGLWLHPTLLETDICDLAHWISQYEYEDTCQNQDYWAEKNLIGENVSAVRILSVALIFLPPTLPTMIGYDWSGNIPSFMR